MNLALGCAFNMKEMFMNFDTRKKLTITSKETEKIIGHTHRILLVKKIFIECLKLVLNDVVDNNVTFILPTTSRPSEIYVKRFKGNDFKRIKKSGGFAGVDILDSDFTGNRIFFKMKGFGREREKPIYTDHLIRDKLIKNTNEKKQYC